MCSSLLSVCPAPGHAFIRLKPFPAGGRRSLSDPLRSTLLPSLPRHSPASLSFPSACCSHSQPIQMSLLHSTSLSERSCCVDGFHIPSLGVKLSGPLHRKASQGPQGLACHDDVYGQPCQDAGHHLQNITSINALCSHKGNRYRENIISSLHCPCSKNKCRFNVRPGCVWFGIGWF